MMLEERKIPMPEPETTESREFAAIWACIKSWDVNVPAYYEGYCGATGSHVQLILSTLAQAGLRVVPESSDAQPQESTDWAIIELMGHVKIAGRASEVEMFGAKLGRVDIPQADGTFVTQMFSGASIYRVTFVSENAARQVAARCQAQPVHRWEMPALREAETVEDADVERDDSDPWADE